MRLSAEQYPQGQPILRRPAIRRTLSEPPQPTPYSSRGPSLKTVTDLCLLLYILYICTPRSLYEAVYPWDYSAEYPLVGITLAAFAIERLRYGLRLRPLLAVLIAVGVMMGIVGIVRETYHGTEARWFLIDCLDYAGLIMGSAWAAARDTRRIVAFLKLACLSCSALLLITIIGLKLGLVEPIVEGARLYTMSYAPCVACVICLVPFVSFSWKARAGTLPWILSGGALGIVFASAVVSATRTVAIQAACAFGFVALFYLRERSMNRLTKLSGVILVTAIVLGSIPVLSDSFLTTRFLEHTPDDVARFAEIEQMLDQMPGHYVLGTGFGSSYPVTPAIEVTGRAFTPHIGILGAFWKGGVVGMVCVVVLPLLHLLVHIRRGWRSPLAQRCVALVSAYIVGACISGGWRFLFLFLFALGCTLAFDLSKTPLPHRLHPATPQQCFGRDRLPQASR